MKLLTRYGKEVGYMTEAEYKRLPDKDLYEVKK